MSSSATKNSSSRNCGKTSMNALKRDTGAKWTRDGTTTPTLTAKFTLLTRGTFLAENTDWRIVVCCCALRLTRPLADWIVELVVAAPVWFCVGARSEEHTSELQSPC